MSNFGTNTVVASVKSLRISPRKLNLIAAMVRNMNTKTALAQLQFSKKRIALDVRKCISSAVANAENNHGLNIDELVITSATVGKSMCLKRMRPRARGRSARISKFFASLYITLTQVSK